MPIPKQVSEAAAMMMIWEDDTAGMNALALTQAFQRWHFDVKTVVLPVNPSVKGSGSQSAFGEYKSWVEEHDKPEKTLVFCYFGHGDIKDGRLRGSNHGNTGRYSIDLTAVQEDARDRRQSHFVFFMECCFGLHLPPPRPSGLNPAFHEHQIELLAVFDGEAEVYGDPDDYSRRLARYIKSNSDPETVWNIGIQISELGSDDEGNVDDTYGYRTGCYRVIRGDEEEENSLVLGNLHDPAVATKMLVRKVHPRFQKAFEEWLIV